MKDLRERLAAAERRLSELLDGCDTLHEKNELRCQELARDVAEGCALEGDLLAAQTEGETRALLQQRAAMSYEAEVVEPLRQKVAELDLQEMAADAQQQESKAGDARRALAEFLKSAGEQEAVLRRKVARAEESAAALQKKTRMMRNERRRLTTEGTEDTE